MSIAKDKDEIIAHKKKAIRSINNLLEHYICSDDAALLKKADLLSYWIEDYSKYISSEQDFEPARLLRYKRGSVLKVDFGFRVGHEMGGLHYAVVIENNNSHNASVITVVPLSSSDGKEIHRDNVDLGSELYQKASDQHKILTQQALKEKEEISELLKALKSADNPTEEMSQAIVKIKQKFDHITKLLAKLNRSEAEIQKIKSGSVAVINQITTISKQRIYIPRKSEDFLAGITLSESALDKINIKISEKFTFQK